MTREEAFQAYCKKIIENQPNVVTELLLSPFNAGWEAAKERECEYEGI